MIRVYPKLTNIIIYSNTHTISNLFIIISFSYTLINRTTFTIYIFITFFWWVRLANDIYWTLRLYVEISDLSITLILYLSLSISFSLTRMEPVIPTFFGGNVFITLRLLVADCFKKMLILCSSVPFCRLCNLWEFLTRSIAL